MHCSNERQIGNEGACSMINWLKIICWRHLLENGNLYTKQYDSIDEH